MRGWGNLPELGWKVRLYKEGDEAGIVRLMNLEPREREYLMARWMWRYKNNPYGFITAVGVHDDEIVGHMGLFLMKIKVGDQTIMGSQASELVVHPNFRRQGMFLTIGKTIMKKAFEEKVWLTYGFPNPPAYRGHLKYGWFDVSMIPVLVTYLNTYEATKNKWTKLKGFDPIMKRFSRFVDYFYSSKRQRKLPAAENVSITEISSFDERINEFWSRMVKNYSIAVVRNCEYLNWRYFQNPEINYKVFLAEKNQVEGFLVTAIQESKGRKVGYFIDVLSTSMDVFQNLICATIEHLSRQSVDSIKCLMLKNHVWYKTLKEHGFTDFTHPKLRMCARVNSSHFFPPYKMAKEWYVTYGDCDFL